MAPTDASSKIASGVSKLSLNPAKAASRKGAKAGASKKIRQPVADSWEDEESTSGSDTESGPSAHYDTDNDADAVDGIHVGTQAPPPTPISPNYNTPATSRQFSPAATRDSNVSPGLNQEPVAESAAPKRPEKTDAVARRMIAGALGMRAPRATEEQRAYDRAVREKERKRQEEERERERKRRAEAEKAKQAVWED